MNKTLFNILDKCTYYIEQASIPTQYEPSVRALHITWT